MKHAGQDAVEQLEPLLQILRSVPSLVEKKPGVFYRKSKAFLHFHEDPSGLYADLRVGENFERYRVQTAKERAKFLAVVRSTGLSH
jgi:hypothetical protein